MPLSAAERLGPYEIIEPIGSGGMGEVYKARDTRLGREVAIKVSREQFSERFEREARAVAALNHPNICQLYDVGPNYLVMELVEGESPKGPLPIETALNYARQIADALDAAHEKGIVHRDLKPANIKIRPDGTLKVLDFGLAKVTQGGPVSGSAEESPTLTVHASEAGMILGTVAYMAPEQARGKQVDKRADIWSFGVVLYELITGNRPFQGEDVSEIMAAIIKDQPDLSCVPAQARLLLEACLEKDPKKRLRDIGDASRLAAAGTRFAEIQARSQGLKSANAIGTALLGRRKIVIAAAVVVVLAIGSLGVVSWRHFHEEEPGPMAVSVLLPPASMFTSEHAVFETSDVPTISPNGRLVVLSLRVGGQRNLWLRDLNALAWRKIAGTDSAGQPFWSPDSRYIAFTADGKLKKVDVDGGPVITLCDAPQGRAGAWNRDGIILFAPNLQGLFQVSANGGTPQAVTLVDKTRSENRHRSPWFLPDGRHFLYTVVSDSSEPGGIYVADLRAEDRLRNRHLIVPVESNTAFSRGNLLYARDGSLFAQRFDLASLQAMGSPETVAENVGYFPAYRTSQFSVSENGTLLYASASGIGNVQLTWFDRTGKDLGQIGPRGAIYWPSISPDGKTVAFDLVKPQTAISDIWLHDLTRGTDTRFTFGSSENSPFHSEYPVWSADGSQISFLRLPFVANGHPWIKSVNGNTPEKPLDDTTRAERPEDWSRDGKYVILGTRNDPKTKFDVWVLPTFGDRKPYPYLHETYSEQHPRLAPNGHWLAYTSDESGRREVYLQSFPTLGLKTQISAEGGSNPIWSHDGSELFFAGADLAMMAVSIKEGTENGKPALQVSVPRRLFQTRFLGGDSATFAVARDGRFLIPTVVDDSEGKSITVVLNWQAALKK